MSQTSLSSTAPVGAATTTWGSTTSPGDAELVARHDHGSVENLSEVDALGTDALDSDANHTHEADAHEAPEPEPTLKVLVYSDDRTTREQVRLALGRRIAPDLPRLEIFDTATQPALISALESAHYDVMVLDGEATPAGGFGLAYQVKDEIANCPPVVLLVARRDDAWLATWSRAEGVSSYPIDPVRLPRTVAEVVRGTRAARPDADAPAETAHA